jgi:hypothetical protein
VMIPEMVVNAVELRPRARMRACSSARMKLVVTKCRLDLESLNIDSLIATWLLSRRLATAKNADVSTKTRRS